MLVRPRRLRIAAIECDLAATVRAMLTGHDRAVHLGQLFEHQLVPLLLDLELDGFHGATIDVRPRGVFIEGTCWFFRGRGHLESRFESLIELDDTDVLRTFELRFGEPEAVSTAHLVRADAPDREERSIDGYHVVVCTREAEWAFDISRKDRQ
jgi:hypothetical protein